MAKRKPKPASADGIATESDSSAEGISAEAQNGASAEGGGADQNAEHVPPPTPFDGEVLDIVHSASTTITGCTDNEMKNFVASADFIARQVTVQLADLWPKICRTNRKATETEGKSPKTSVACSIKINHENLLLMDTKVKMKISEAHETTGEIQQDLRQVTFRVNGHELVLGHEDEAASTG